jgi:hypothetical protein
LAKGEQAVANPMIEKNTNMITGLTFAVILISFKIKRPLFSGHVG